MKDKNLNTEEHANSDLGAVSSRAWLFQYRSCGKDLMVQLEASSFNDVLVLFATHYHMVDEIYEIAEVFSTATNNR